ncbi:glycosyltransferase family A protein [Alloalcanivorax xenomutans]|uniref:glycosyltransferase family A protein n=1 Tax=Alloalcanivorax xenomutans TaxID=1094342 RepID=UPI0030099D77
MSSNGCYLLSLCFSCDDLNYKKAIEQSLLVLSEEKSVCSVIIVQNLHGTFKFDHEDLDLYREKRIFIYFQEGKGLSRSRNLGLEKSKSNYVWILDGDVEFDIPIVSKLIFSLRNRSEKKSTLSIKIKCTECNKPYKNYKNKKMIKKSDFLKISSIEMIIAKAEQEKREVWFDEKLGLGAKYKGTEEVDFLLRFHGNDKDSHEFLDLFPAKHTCLGENRSRPEINIFYARGALLKKIGGLESVAIFIYWGVKFSFRWKNASIFFMLYEGYRHGLPD